MEDNVKKNQFEIVIDDGSVKVPVKNLHGDEIGVFYFHPTDVGLIERYNQIVDKLDDIVAPLEHVAINPDGTAEDGNSVDAATLQEAEKRMFEACDFLFGGNVSSAFFGSMHPFSPVGGGFYCETVLASVGKFISAQFERETKKIKSKTERYLGKYQSGHNGKK